MLTKHARILTTVDRFVKSRERGAGVPNQFQVLIDRFLGLIDGLSLREADRETGVSYTTIGQLKRGELPDLQPATRRKIETYVRKREGSSVFPVKHDAPAKPAGEQRALQVVQEVTRMAREDPEAFERFWKYYEMFKELTGQSLEGD